MWGPADIVVPTLGRPSLARLLKALCDTGPACAGKLILVDDRKHRSDPLPIPDLPAGWQKRIVVLPGKAAGPAAARNIGWRASSAAWVAFLDDDVVPVQAWPERLKEDLAGCSGETGGSQGQVKVPLPGDRPPTDWERNVAGLETARWVTADMAYRREVLETVGGFDERFRRAYREDADLAIRVRQAGYGLARGSRTVLHPPGPAKFWISLKLQAGNADDALMRRIHGAGWRDVAGTGPPRMPLHAASTLALAAAMLGPKKLRGGFCALWAVLTAGFAWKRIDPGPRTGEELARMILTTTLIPPAAVLHRLSGELRAGCSPKTGRPMAFPAGGIPLGEAPIRAVLFDRDGTLVEDVPYNGDPGKVEPKPGAVEAIRRLKEAGIPTGVVSNQSGVARGLLTTTEVRLVNEKIEQVLGPLGPWVICEHGSQDRCTCRKPAPGMIIEAARRLGVHPRECVVIGDIGADVEAARQAGARSILIPGPITLPEEVAAAPVVVRGLPEAIDLILGRAEDTGK